MTGSSELSDKIRGFKFRSIWFEMLWSFFLYLCFLFCQNSGSTDFASDYSRNVEVSGAEWSCLHSMQVGQEDRHIHWQESTQENKSRMHPNGINSADLTRN